MKLVIREPETSALERALRGMERVMSSEISEVEVARAVRRRRRGALDRRLEAVLRSVDLLTFDRRSRTRAAELQPASLRSLDAIHVASALNLEYPKVAFVGYDRRLQEAAAAAGLEILSPGA